SRPSPIVRRRCLTFRMHRSLLVIALGLIAASCSESIDFPVPRELDGSCSREWLTAVDLHDVNLATRLRARGAQTNCPLAARMLDEAVRYDRTSDLKILLESGVSPNTGPGEFTPPRALFVALAVRRDDRRGIEATRLLLEHGADMDQRASYPIGLIDATPLMGAASLGDIDFARELLRFGADVNTRNRFGKNALDFATDEKHAAMVDLLTSAAKAARP